MTYCSLVSWIVFHVGEAFGDLTLDRFPDRAWPFRANTSLMRKSSDWQGDSPIGPWAESA